MSAAHVRVALLGAGFMGQTHARAWSATDGGAVAVVVARSAARARALADTVGARWTTDVSSVLSDDGVDAVDIAYPTFLHRTHALDAIRAGKHVLVEKPIAASVHEGEEMASAAEHGGRILMVGHVLEFWPEYAYVREMVRRGAWGRPLALEATRLSTPPDWAAWLTDPNLSGGVIVDLSVHDFAFANALLGAPSALWTAGVARPGPRYDQHTTVVSHAGAVASITGSEMMPAGFPFTAGFRLVLEEAVVEYSFRAAGAGVESGQATNVLRLWGGQGPARVVEVAQHDPFQAEVACFLAAVRSGEPPDRGTPADAILALRVALAASESMRTGSVVAL